MFPPRAPAGRGEAAVVTIGMNYVVLPGRERVFEDACEKVVEAMRGVAGHDESHLYKRLDDGDHVYLIVSRWTSDEAFRTFVASDRFKKVTRWGMQNVLAGPPRHTTYRED
jgi:heme-degrading monooxygenase HmoA